MIDSITKTPELTDAQKKYLNYEIEYQNNEQIISKQLLKANSLVRLIVNVEYKKDLSSNDLPTTTNSLNLAFKVNYVQSDKDVLSVTNSGKVIKVVKGEYDKQGSEVCIENECFYVLSSNDTEILLLTKYNLYVGNKVTKYDSSAGIIELQPIDNPTGIQSSTSLGWVSYPPWIATIPFSSTTYWSSTVSTYPTYVYNENSNLYKYINNYKKYIEQFGVSVNEARLITYNELDNLGCDSATATCPTAPSWVYQTSYWAGDAGGSNVMWGIDSDGVFSVNFHGSHARGIRPVLAISRSFF